MRRLGISGVALGKTCRKHGIPVPERGYWARLAARQKPKKPPLPHFVTELFRSVVPAPAVQALAGHASLTTTQLYAHVVAKDLRDAISTLRGNGVETSPKRRGRAA